VSLELVTGPMFSGKTHELIRGLAAAEERGERVAAAKPSFDLDEGWLVSLAGVRRPASPLAGVDDLVALARGRDVVGVDEVQFLAREVVDGLVALADSSVRVLVAGLDLDFLGRPFPGVALLAACAASVSTLTAVCVRCGDVATRSQRLVDGRPAPRTSPLVQLGGGELYEPRCVACHVVPRATRVRAPIA